MTTKKKHKTRTVIKDASGWYDDIYQSAVVQRNFLLLVTLICLFGVGVSALAVIDLSHSKSIEPFIIEVDKKSGVTTVVDPITVDEYSADEAINNYFIVRYLRSRELFDPNTFEHNFYKETRLMSSQDVYNDFVRGLRSDNKESPFNVYAGVKSSSIKIKSIQYIAQKSAQVRFRITASTHNGIIKKDKIAVVAFDHAKLNLGQDDRYINPLGFLVTSYRLDNEYL